MIRIPTDKKEPQNLHSQKSWGEKNIYLVPENIHESKRLFQLDDGKKKIITWKTGVSSNIH